MKQLRTWFFFGGKRYDVSIYYTCKKSKYNLVMILGNNLQILPRYPRFNSLQEMKKYVRDRVRRTITMILDEE